MNARNMKELTTMLNKEVRKAMQVTQKKALEDMYAETGGFYTGGEPKMYERTGALGDTPRTTALTTSGNEVSFEAYLDTDHKYTTGKEPTMEDVLNLTKGIPKHKSSVGYLRSAVGNNGFWERAEDKIERDFNETFNKFFK